MRFLSFLFPTDDHVPDVAQHSEHRGFVAVASWSPHWADLEPSEVAKIARRPENKHVEPFFAVIVAIKNPSTAVRASNDALRRRFQVDSGIPSPISGARDSSQRNEGPSWSIILCRPSSQATSSTSLPRLAHTFRFLSHHPATPPSIPSKAYLLLPPPSGAVLLAPALPVIVVPHDHRPLAAVALRFGHALPVASDTQITELALDAFTTPESPTPPAPVVITPAPFTSLPYQTWFNPPPRETHARHVDPDPRSSTHYVYPGPLTSLSPQPTSSTSLTVSFTIPSVVARTYQHTVAVVTTYIPVGKTTHDSPTVQEVLLSRACTCVHPQPKVGFVSWPAAAATHYFRSGQPQDVDDALDPDDDEEMDEVDEQEWLWRTRSATSASSSSSLHLTGQPQPPQAHYYAVRTDNKASGYSRSRAHTDPSGAEKVGLAHAAEIPYGSPVSPRTALQRSAKSAPNVVRGSHSKRTSAEYNKAHDSVLMMKENSTMTPHEAVLKARLEGVLRGAKEQERRARSRDREGSGSGSGSGTSNSMASSRNLSGEGDFFFEGVNEYTVSPVSEQAAATAIANKRSSISHQRRPSAASTRTPSSTHTARQPASPQPKQQTVNLLTPPPTPPVSPASPFNAHTAAAQCRAMDGYVSFATIEGLGVPEGEDDNGEEDSGRTGRWLKWLNVGGAARDIARPQVPRPFGMRFQSSSVFPPPTCAYRASH
ncbi:hypothetical protein EUX98_g2795 [Antrodiella citrinella]|uniref:Uncharacterized protein n=1 Tax=Antrodiella citrinella TaxID=2447956 RepID=A0A4S4MZI0_9APHY|nr:hypothetical protein EUX98_g2795 [Antrodiella citrinella]